MLSIDSAYSSKMSTTANFPNSKESTALQTTCDIDVAVQELRGTDYQPVHRILMTAEALYLIVLRADKPISGSLHTFLITIKVSRLIIYEV